MFFFHVIDGFVLTIRNRKARPVKYIVEKGSANANWSSRNMALLGTILLVFIVTHMQNFWYVMHFGEVSKMIVGGEDIKDLHTVVMNFFNPAINSYALNGGFVRFCDGCNGLPFTTRFF